MQRMFLTPLTALMAGLKGMSPVHRPHQHMSRATVEPNWAKRIQVSQKLAQGAAIEPRAVRRNRAHAEKRLHGWRDKRNRYRMPGADTQVVILPD